MIRQLYGRRLDPVGLVAMKSETDELTRAHALANPNEMVGQRTIEISVCC
jgi:hypothetical protein